MKVLAIDHSSTATGVVFLECQNNSIHINHMGVESFKSTGIYRLSDWRDKINSLISRFQPNLICRELHSLMQYGNAYQLLHIAAAFDLICHDRLYLDNYCILPVPTWKKFVTGKGQAKKDSSYLLIMNESFRKIKHLKLDSVIRDDNISDALSIGITGIAAYGIRHGMKGDMFHDKNQAFKKGVDSYFEHGNSGK